MFRSTQLFAFSLVALATLAFAAPARAAKRSSASTTTTSVSTSSSEGEIKSNALYAAPSLSATTSNVRVVPMVGLDSMALRDGNVNAGERDSGALVGGVVEIGRGPLTFQTGLLYQQLGGRGTSRGVNVKYNLDALSVPLAAKFNFGADVAKTVFIKAGVEPTILTSKTGNLYFGDQPASSKTGFRSTDVLATIGVGGV